MQFVMLSISNSNQQIQVACFNQIMFILNEKFDIILLKIFNKF